MQRIAAENELSDSSPAGGLSRGDLPALSLLGANRKQLGEPLLFRSRSQSGSREHGYHWVDDGSVQLASIRGTFLRLLHGND